MGFDYDALYSAGGFANISVKAAVKELVKRLPARSAEGPILDLGAGDGRHTKYLADRGHQIIAVDQSKVAIQKLEELARKDSRNITTVHANLSEVETLPQQQFAAVICTYVIHDLSPNTIKTVAQYINEQALPGSYFAFAAYLGKFRGLVETAREQFEDWDRIRSLPGKTRNLAGAEFQCIEMLLQKPEE